MKPATQGAGGICGKHGVYDGIHCPKCKQVTDPTRLATEGRALPYMGRRRLDQGEDLAG